MARVTDHFAEMRLDVDLNRGDMGYLSGCYGLGFRRDHVNQAGNKW